MTNTASIPQPTPTRQHRFHALDAVRGIAAVLVVLFHVPTRLRLLVPQSFLAVDLFFILSGFVIAYSYEERLRTSMSMRTFTFARVIRLYPLYLLGTCIGLLDALLLYVHSRAHGLGAALLPLPTALLFLPSFLTKATDPQLYPLNMPAWSLFFEIVANIVYGLLMRARWAATPLLAIISLASMGALIGTNSSVNGGWTFPTFLPGLLRVGFAFFAGVLLFRLYRSGVRVHLRGKLAVVVASLVILAVAACVCFPVAATNARLFGFVSAGVVFPLCVFFGAGCDLAPAWRGLCDFLGDFSYPLYVLHYPLVFFVAGAEHLKSHLVSTLFGPAVVLLLIPASWWVGKHFDIPVRKYLASRI